MSRKILITGGTGFVGSNLIHSLMNNYEFISIGRSKNNLCNNIYWDYNGNLSQKINTRIDLVIHCASIVGNSNLDKSQYIDVNVKSTLELLEFCFKNNVKKFIYLSTGGVYGYNNNEFSEDAECNPLDIYSMSKFFSEKLCSLYNDKISIIILRLFFPYGIGQNGRLISSLISKVLKGEEITLNKNGYPIINPIHIIDVSNIISKLLEIECSGIFNICGDECISVEDLCKKIAFNYNVERINLVYNNNYCTNLIGCNKKVCDFLNYKMNIDLDTGIKLSTF